MIRARFKKLIIRVAGIALIVTALSSLLNVNIPGVPTYTVLIALAIVTGILVLLDW
jgi:hypothetical protein